MATEQPVFVITLEASGDLSTNQYCLVKPGTTPGQVSVATAATDSIIGVLQNKPSAAGQAAEVMVVGISKVKMSAAITANGSNFVTATTGGAGLSTTTAGQHVVGLPLLSAANANDYIPVLVLPCTI